MCHAYAFRLRIRRSPGKVYPSSVPQSPSEKGVKMNLSSYLLFFYISVEGNRFESVDGFQTKMCIRDAYARFQ